MQLLETMEQYNELISKDKVVLLFTADWCPDCRVIEPILPELEDRFSDYTFVMINRDQFIELCQELDVFGIPSFIAMHKGQEAGRFVSKNRKTKEEIEQFLEDLFA
ncbi:MULTISPECIES: thioredoxin family protein [unclassified Virgibacillus]|uniref:thioredoxin family protein n=1 Tax=unclassified Virgibacillus TaxID=2620237 RepID=UPI0024DE3C7D|nr:thioredoxin family protein [Virgibacillus sp. LDC-1]